MNSDRIGDHLSHLVSTSHLISVNHVARSGSWIGASHVVRHQVNEHDLVTSLFPGVAVFATKPPVIATALLGALAEWSAMEAIALRVGDHEESLGTGYEIEHLRAIEQGVVLQATAVCTEHTGRASAWKVRIADDLGTVAIVRAAFVVVDRARFIAKHLSCSVAVPN